MRKKLLTKVTSVVLAIAITMSMTACGKSTISTTSPTVSEDTTSDSSETETSTRDEKETFSSVTNNDTDRTSKEAIAEQERFDSVTRNFFKEEIVNNTLSMHSIISNPKNFGIDSYDVTLGGDLTGENDETIRKLEDAIQTIQGFNYDYLTDEQQLTYDIFIRGSKDTIKLCDYEYYNNPLAPQNGFHSYLPTLLSEYAFYREQDVKDYLEILDICPDYFENIMDYMKEQSNLGLFMPDFAVDKVVEECQQFITNPDNHYLIDTFNRRIDEVSFLSDNQKADYKNQNIDKLKNSLFKAYRYLIDELPKLKGTCKNEGGLCNFENGKEYYELLLQDYTSCGDSVEEICELIENQLEEDFAEIFKIAATDYDAATRMVECRNYSDDPEETLKFLQEEAKKDFPSAPSDQFIVNYVPESIEEQTNPAYYLLPPIDDLNNNKIYINKNYIDQNDDTTAFTTLAHEGFPGHMLQTTYYYSQNPSVVRKMFSFNGYEEGWGMYSELFSYNYTGNDTNAIRMGQLNTSYAFALYSRVDIGVHYEGWTRKDTAKYLLELGYDEDVSDQIYETILTMPAVYPSYYVGYLKFMDLRERAEKALGSDFSLKEFHTFVLSIGPAYFELIEDRMDTWLETQIGSHATDSEDFDDFDDNVLWFPQETRYRYVVNQ